MKNKVFKYKGQLGSVEPDLNRGYLYGKLLYINDLITFEAGTIPELESAFRAAVDEYLEDCADLGVEPNKPFSGSFNIRAGEELHRKMALEAADRGINLNEACIQAFKGFLGQPEGSIVEHVHNHNHKHHFHFEVNRELGFDLAAGATEPESSWSVRSPAKIGLQSVN